MLTSPSLIAALVVVAFCAGAIDAIAGGGGLLTVPSLLAAGLPPHLALGTNKGQSVFGSAAATLTFLRRGVLDRQRARITFPLGLLGSLAGASLVLLVPPKALAPLVLVLLPVAASTLLLPKRERSAATLPPARMAAIAGSLSLVIGAYDGFFGPGTGTFLVLSFAAFLHLPLLSASADAKVVNLASNLAALSIFAFRGNVLWHIALPMACAQLVGGMVGARFAMRGGERLIRAIVLVVVASLMIKLAYDLTR